MIKRKLRCTISIDGIRVEEGTTVNVEYAFATDKAPRGVLVVISWKDMVTTVLPEHLDAVDPNVTNDEEIDFDEFRVKPHPSFEDRV
jgi:hypothetical protein